MSWFRGIASRLPLVHRAVQSSPPAQALPSSAVKDEASPVNLKEKNGRRDIEEENSRWLVDEAPRRKRTLRFSDHSVTHSARHFDDDEAIEYRPTKRRVGTPLPRRRHFIDDDDDDDEEEEVIVVRRRREEPQSFSARRRKRVYYEDMDDDSDGFIERIPKRRRSAPVLESRPALPRHKASSAVARKILDALAQISSPLDEARQADAPALRLISVPPKPVPAVTQTTQTHPPPAHDVAPPSKPTTPLLPPLEASPLPPPPISPPVPASKLPQSRDQSSPPASPEPAADAQLSEEEDTEFKFTEPFDEGGEVVQTMPIAIPAYYFSPPGSCPPRPSADEAKIAAQKLAKPQSAGKGPMPTFQLKPSSQPQSPGDGVGDGEFTDKPATFDFMSKLTKPQSTAKSPPSSFSQPPLIPNSTPAFDIPKPLNFTKPIGVPAADNAEPPAAGPSADVPKLRNGWGDMFKPKEGEWKCETCLVRNSKDALKCVSCESPKPSAAEGEPKRKTVTFAPDAPKPFSFASSPAPSFTFGGGGTPTTAATDDTKPTAPTFVFGAAKSLAPAPVPVFGAGSAAPKTDEQVDKKSAQPTFVFGAAAPAPAPAPAIFGGSAPAPAPAPSSVPASVPAFSFSATPTPATSFFAFPPATPFSATSAAPPAPPPAASPANGMDTTASPSHQQPAAFGNFGGTQPSFPPQPSIFSAGQSAAAATTSTSSPFGSFGVAPQSQPFTFGAAPAQPSTFGAAPAFPAAQCGGGFNIGVTDKNNKTRPRRIVKARRPPTARNSG